MLRFINKSSFEGIFTAHWASLLSPQPLVYAFRIVFMSTFKFLEFDARFKFLKANHTTVIFCPAFEPHFRSDTIDLGLAEPSIHIATSTFL